MARDDTPDGAGQGVAGAESGVRAVADTGRGVGAPWSISNKVIFLILAKSPLRGAGAPHSAGGNFRVAGPAVSGTCLRK